MYEYRVCINHMKIYTILLVRLVRFYTHNYCTNIHNNLIEHFSLIRFIILFFYPEAKSGRIVIFSLPTRFSHSFRLQCQICFNILLLYDSLEAVRWDHRSFLLQLLQDLWCLFIWNYNLKIFIMSLSINFNYFSILNSISSSTSLIESVV